ncbi:MAG: penicillin acylase family protein [Hydrogenophaga sp.]|uniref:penicillin acylase family protein n=1 Tax=Hydrogenophaga sp. TaxID=1904254 RepID=UPI001D6A3D0F|nr:penicillin acylase family protein [Hydrogenophaga sp.]MBX3611379.1 penicillin acylase family protein [Hydrogenophaga sp.]
MRWIRRLLSAIGLLLVLSAAMGIWYVRQTLPQLDGQLRLAGLSAPVQVNRDSSDVTHILAQRSTDAWMALGYVHAQERGWQLAFNRAVMRGRLSEFLGPATLETDKLLRTLGIRQVAQRQLATLPSEARQAMEAYSTGVNAFFASSDQARTPEFLVLGVDPGASARDGAWWDAADSVGWSLMMALDLGGNWGNEFARLTALQVLDTDAMWALFPPYEGEPRAATADLARLYRELGVYREDAFKTTAQAPPQLGGLRERIAAGLQAWTEAFGHTEGKGSNNWVVSGARTTSGLPLLANDPHLGLSAPAIWYFARLQAPDVAGLKGMDVIGATLPGTPFVVLGRTANLAWGFTNTGPDVQDLYLEQINPANGGEYRVPSTGTESAWAPFKVRVETIKVKGQGDVTHLVRSTRHGPVISDAQARYGEVIDTSRYVLALRWTALEADDGNVLATIEGNRAQSVDELRLALRDFRAPMQNVVMADRQGRIAYKAAGQVPVRAADNDIRGVAPSPGWEARYDWTGWLPYEQTPEDDGAKGWIATANQRVHGPDYPHFLTQDWVPPYRQRRIEEMLQQTLRHDVASFRAMQGDLYAAATVRLLPFLLKARSDHPQAAAAMQALQGFDGVMASDSVAALIFSVWVDEFARGVIGTRLGKARFATIYGKRNFRAAVEGILASDDPAWCGASGCAAASSVAFTRALQRIVTMCGDDVAQWRWGDVHPAISAHRPFAEVKPLARLFNVTVPTGGDPFTVNVGQYHLDKVDAPFANRHAASLRAIYDLADLDRSRFIYQTGQSGNVFSSRYRDMSEAWAANESRVLSLNPSGWAHQLELTP